MVIIHRFIVHVKFFYSFFYFYVEFFKIDRQNLLTTLFTNTHCYSTSAWLSTVG